MPRNYDYIAELAPRRLLLRNSRMVGVAYQTLNGLQTAPTDDEASVTQKVAAVIMADASK